MYFARSLRWAWAAVLLLPAVALAGGARVSGRVEIGMPGTSLDAVAPLVVFLDAGEGEAQLEFDVPVQPVRILQKNASFSPAFGIVVKGQEVDMPNLDGIYHNVFSYSRPNDFDLGLYPAGDSRSIRFQHPGIVKTYCSIHESMNLTIFVAPSPWYAVVSATGRFEISGVRPGRYVLRTWAERLPMSAREITLEEGASIELELMLLDDAS